MTFLMYINSQMYAAQKEALVVLNNVSLLLFFFFMINFEIDAVKHWNPFGSYTPSINNPRCAYHNVSQSSQWSIGFDVLSIFTPVRFKEYFPYQSQEIASQFQQSGFSFGQNYRPFTEEENEIRRNQRRNQVSDSEREIRDLPPPVPLAALDAAVPVDFEEEKQNTENEISRIS